MTNNASIQDVLFFPQMRPEQGREKVEEVAPANEAPADLNENEKVVYGLLTSDDSELLAVKESAGLSNSKWDKAVKGLKAAGLAEVWKDGDVLKIKLS
jgi:lysyl-tRNA synthetase class 2